MGKRLTALTKRVGAVFGLAAVLTIGWGIGRPAGHLALAWYADPNVPLPASSEGFRDDASGLEEVPVGEVVVVTQDVQQTEDKLRRAFALARARGTSVSIGGAQHTMGGHTLWANGVFVDMSGHDGMWLDGDVLRVQAGARWRQVIPFLHGSDKAVIVMQTNDDFSIGGTLSANAHGWQHGRPPVASTVRSFTLMTPDGTVRRCSRGENPHLFRHALGGYGLFGVMLEVELDVMDNQLYASDGWVVDKDDFVAAWRENTRHADVQMVYGRLSMDPSTFMEEARLTVYRRVEQNGDFPEIVPIRFAGLKRTVLRGSQDSPYGRELRWQLEKMVGGERGGVVQRAQLQAGPSEVFENRDPRYTDVLHEYFVPPDAVPAFIEAARTIVLRDGADLLNVTVRHVEADEDTVLRYADQEVFSFVMLFVYERTKAADDAMAATTRALIDAAHSAGGRYYLPYRPHATKEQFRRSYPMAGGFFAEKLRVDPDELLQNGFYLRYR
jgi:FAD/FMN-containing dehydrogenase